MIDSGAFPQDVFRGSGTPFYGLAGSVRVIPVGQVELVGVFIREADSFRSYEAFYERIVIKLGRRSVVEDLVGRDLVFQDPAGTSVYAPA